MLDPIPVPPLLRDAIQPLATRLHLLTLPLHIHEIVLSYALYNLIDTVLAPLISRRLFPNHYRAFSRRTQLQWNMHVTSLVNSTFISLAAIYVLYADVDRLSDTWEQRMWGYTGAGGMVQAFGAGFFIWDLQICAANVKTLGVPDLVHALMGFIISFLGFRPFGLFYGIQYALVELSTPFVNFHWFLNKLNKAGSTLQLVNGMILITVFGCCRLLWGSYMTKTFFGDVWTALHAPRSSWTTYNYSPTQKPLVLQHHAEWWVGIVFLATHTVVMSLSIFWFGKMIATMRRPYAGSNGKRKAK
ncbi:hypothetical protein LTR33_006063 [Friedmanniomyces endolithicus]|nr:hypothetical protein LTR33_006063 [Friedmanniomyces endolithicus]